MDTPVTSGTDLISNPGNAALGYSASAGHAAIPYGTSPDSKPLDGLDSTIDKLQDEEAKVQVMRYQQRLKEAEDLKKSLAQTGGSVFNTADANGKNASFTPLPQDKVVLDQGADELRRIKVGNPQGYAYDPDVYKKEQELRALTMHAGERAVFNSKANVDAGTENDPEERQAILDNRDQNLSHPLTDFHPLDPHLPKLGFQEKTFFNPAKFSKDNLVPISVVVGHDAQGNEITESRLAAPINEVDVRPSITPGNKQAWAEANNALNRFNSSKMSLNPSTYVQQGQEASAFNSEHNFKPGDAHYMPSLATILPNGQISRNNLSAADFVYATMGAKYGATTPDVKLQEDASKLADAAEERKNKESQIGDRSVKNKLKGQEQTETHRHNVAMENKDENKNENKPEVDNAFSTVIRSQADANSATSYPLSKALKTLPASQQQVINQTLKEKGLNPKDYDVVPLDNNNQTIQSISGIQNQAGNGEYIDGSAKPKSSIMLKAHSGNLNDNFYVVGHTSLEPDVNPETGIVNIGEDKKPSYKQKDNVKLIDASTAGGNRIKEIHNFKVTDKSGTSMSDVSNRLKDVMKVRKAADGKVYYQTKDGVIHEL